MRLCLLVIALCLTAAGQDFLNGFRYTPSCTGNKPVTVQKGHNKLFFLVVSVNLGDMTGDFKPEAFVVTYCNSGGSGRFTEGYLYDLSGPTPREITRVKPGDRALGGIQSVRFALPELEISRFEGKAACCPEELRTLRYKLLKGKLVESGPVEIRKLPPQ